MSPLNPLSVSPCHRRDHGLVHLRVVGVPGPPAGEGRHGQAWGDNLVSSTAHNKVSQPSQRSSGTSARVFPMALSHVERVQGALGGAPRGPVGAPGRDPLSYQPWAWPFQPGGKALDVRSPQRLPVPSGVAELQYARAVPSAASTMGSSFISNLSR